MSGTSTGFSSTAPAKKARIEIIPLIDVIFFLLATFVLFTLSLNRSGGLPVILPASLTSESRNSQGAVTISFTAEGSIGWDKDLITLDEFITRLQAYKQTEPDPRILINGDETAMFSQSRYVIDEIRKAGITKVLLETRIRSTDS
ncbi:biopolymer transporter ExbD [Nibricoccus aquaticus]|uniref:Biopolymer transporter ExbD n=1 Tax=Nibricoccus aquaticus TaxID=2576891 RepID=A0A290Q978_9BACT|nr:biopolymer transporter ExbD [Nibricoccus aquaticus]ATC64797.1 biopolymer transporter ExbD [Nibricoccus aquaticus]